MIIYTGPQGLSKSEANSCGEGAASGRGEGGTLLPADVQMPPEAQPGGRKGGPPVEHWASGSGRSVTVPVVGLWALELQVGACAWA